MNPYIHEGARVRVVYHDNCPEFIVNGEEYRVEAVSSCAKFVQVRGGSWLHVSRFKPVVRVKAECKPSLPVLLMRANAVWAKLTPEQREAELRAQRESWVRGEMALRRMGLG